MSGDLLEILLGALAGGVGKTVLDRLVNYQKYKGEIKRGAIENDALASAQWRILYDDLRTDYKELKLRIDTLEIENESLRKKYMDLQHQVSFSDKNT